MTRLALVLAMALLANGCFLQKKSTHPLGKPESSLRGPPPTRTETLGRKAVPIPERIEDAVDLIDSGQVGGIERAQALLLDVVTDAPDNALGWFDLGVADQHLGKLDDARQAYTKAVDVDPKLAAAWVDLGLVEEAQHHADLAVGTYRTGLRTSPENTDLRVALIGALRRSGHVDEAIAEAKAALKVNANALAIYNDLGLAYMDAGKLDLAKFVYQKALNGIEGAQTSADVHANLGRVYQLDGDDARARFYLEKAVKLDPQSVPALVYLSNLYLQDHNYADTVPLLERAYAQQPNNHGVVMDLGIAYRGVQRYDDARKMYDKALSIDPSDPSPWFDIGILLGDYLKQYDAAIAAFQKYIDARGAKARVAATYITDLRKERELAAKKAKLEQERKAREAERAQRQRLLQQANQGSNESTPAPAPAPAPKTAPAPTSPTPAPTTSGNPWGSLEKGK